MWCTHHADVGASSLIAHDDDDTHTHVDDIADAPLASQHTCHYRDTIGHESCSTWYGC